MSGLYSGLSRERKAIGALLQNFHWGDSHEASQTPFV